MRFPSFTVLVALVSAPWVAAQQVTGIKAGVNLQTGERPARLNIDDLHGKGGPAWDLFVQALTAIEAAPDNDWLSWYQIAGIHGLPFKPYNGVDQVPGGAADAGYCPHSQITFITWHRPYLALLEQTLQAEAEKIAARYTGTSAAAYKAAAETLRFPYWDWAVSAQMPPITMEPAVQINAPNGPVTLRNPLYSYQFQNFPFTDPDFQGYKVTQFNETKRCADSQEGSDGINHFDIANELLGGHSENLRDLTYAVFTKSSKFEDMASTGGRGSSFENPHNIVHQNIGGGPLSSKTGHIQPVVWSGFDPIFWLHHSNVDRHFAMWQAIYYTAPMFNGSAFGQAIYGTPAGPVTASTPLKPFVDGAGAFWTSTRSTSTREFGYTYPGLNDWAVSPPELAKQITAEVNRLYGRPAAAADIAGDEAAAQQKDYAVQIQVDRADASLDLPATIEVVLGDTVVGEYALLAMPKAGKGTASIPLQRALEKAGVAVEGRPAGEVVTAVKEKMKIVVRNEGGEVAPPASVRSLVVEIEDWDVTPAQSESEFLHYGKMTSWPVDLKGIDP